jgi:hypothetical protein
MPAKKPAKGKKALGKKAMKKTKGGLNFAINTLGSAPPQASAAVATLGSQNKPSGLTP